jgi:hypothetical protein
VSFYSRDEAKGASVGLKFGEAMACSSTAFNVPAALRPQWIRPLQQRIISVRGGERAALLCSSKSDAARLATLPAASSHSSHGNLRHSRIIARKVWESAVTPGAVCIDATSGNGSDTVQLARLAGPTGLVHALDIQPEAVSATELCVAEAMAAGEKLAPVRGAVRCHTSFCGLERVDKGCVSAVTYNLGWFPGRDADRRVVTNAHSTLASLCAAAELVKVGGVITIMAYVGHLEGPAEAAAVAGWVSKLDPKVWSSSAPMFFILERIAADRS